MPSRSLFTIASGTMPALALRALTKHDFSSTVNDISRYGVSPPRLCSLTLL
ncbi:hypothetical protein [Dasania marina]|uniref:hypothetical protein n=1 Tax=Dasania marina TaxID=471499 RepID=UPI0030D71F0D